MRKHFLSADILAAIVIIGCFFFIWNGKNGVIVAILLTVVSNRFGDVYKRIDKDKKE